MNSCSKHAWCLIRAWKLRVYQTNSTHKSMSALRQGSMLLVEDVEFHRRGKFHEAVFTHASTSPNQQLIASLDVARRQMELEGYGLVSTPSRWHWTSAGRSPSIR